MAKGWIKIKTVNDMPSANVTSRDRAKKDHTYDTMIRTSKTYTTHELKKEGNILFADRVANNDSLIEAYNNKKLKSKRLIRRAENLISKKNEREKRSQKNGDSN